MGGQKLFDESAMISQLAEYGWNEDLRSLKPHQILTQGIRRRFDINRIR